MTALQWAAVALVGTVIVGLFALVLVPNRALPDPLMHDIGSVSREGLLTEIIGGI